MDKPIVTVRNASLDDVPLICRMGEKIWWEHYPGIITDAQIAYMLAKGYSEKSILEQMQVKSQSFYLAEIEGKPVAYAAYSIKTNGKRTYMYVNKLYGCLESRGTGAGYKLLMHLVGDAHKRGIRYARLNVNKYNPTVEWYKRQGFTVFEEEVLHIGFGMVMDDYVLELKMDDKSF